MRLRTTLLAASLALVTSTSLANGRFPLSQRLFQDQSNPDGFALSTTFGLLVTRDHGQNWYHVCEGALTPELLEADPLLEVLPDGSMLAALVRPLRRSEDCGCTFTPVLGDAANTSVTDIAKGGPNTVLALMRTSEPTIVYHVERSTDGGRTWNMLSELPRKLQAFTLDAAPSNPMRVYVSATLSADPDAGIPFLTNALFVSDDGGATWSAPRPLGVANDGQPYIAAVHPTNPDTVYVRTDAWTLNEDMSIDEANDALVVTDDAGMEFREVLRKHAKLFGFALSPDAATVLAGYGDPQQAARLVYPDETGIYTANTADFAFTQVMDAPVSCLTWNTNALYACFDTMVGVAPAGAVPATRAEFTSLLAFADVKGPLACNANGCLPEWQEGREDVASVCDRLGAVCEVDPAASVVECTPAGGSSGSGTGGSGASAGAASGGATNGGSTSTGGAGPSAGLGGSPPGGAGGATSGESNSGASSDDDSGSSCGCRSPGTSGRSGVFAVLAALAALGVLGRTRAKQKR
jgi:MYXO-CTERM domain-containing protein